MTAIGFEKYLFSYVEIHTVLIIALEKLNMRD